MVEENDDPEESEDYSFGPAPSEATQIKVGERRSRGRPKGAKGKKKIVADIFRERHEVRENGRVRSLTTLEIILKVVRNASLDNDRAFEFVESLKSRYEPQSRAPRHILGVFPEKGSEELWQKKYGHPEADEKADLEPR